MKVHIITVGDEILIGQTLNTNAAFIGELLTNNNIEVHSSSVIGDNINEIISEFERCWKKYDVIIVTGGLGPTHDDVTKLAITTFFNTELIRNEDVFHDVVERFKKLNRHMAKVNEDQALVPKIANVIRNNYGTAPGLMIEKDKKFFFSLPGVPHEMKAMMTDFVVEKLKETVDKNKVFIKKITLLTTGIGESALFEKLGNFHQFLGNAKLAFLPSEYGTKIRITVKENSEEEAVNKLYEIEQKIRSLAGRYIYGKNDEELAEIIGRLLLERGLTISTAESCTGGNVANLITNFSGSSKYFERGVVVYSNAAKVEILHVDEDLILNHGAVSAIVAEQMAKGIRSVSGSDIGIGITGILGPTGGTTEKPVGTVFIALSDIKSSFVQKFNFGDDRRINKSRASQAALDMIRKYLLGITLDA